MDGHDYLLLPRYPECYEYETRNQTIGIRKEDGIVYVYYPPMEIYGQTQGYEYMIYDYNAEPGYEYTSVLNEAWEWGESYQIETTARVIDTGKIHIFGKDHIVQELALQFSPYELDYIIVEDIGVIHGPGVMAQPSHYGVLGTPTSTMYSFRYLHSISNNNGLSYSRTDLGLSLTPQIVIDTLTWIYYSCDDKSEAIHNMGFGDEQTIDGLRYKCFYTESSIHRSLADGEISSFQYDSPSDRYWLMRENFGKVFMRECSGGIFSDEILLYDFTLQNGETFSISTETPAVGTVCINKPKAITFLPDHYKFYGYDSDERKSYSLDDSDYEIIEIAGPSGHNAGFLASPPFLRQAIDDPVNPPSECSLAIVLPNPPATRPLYKTEVWDENVKPLLDAAGLSSVTTPMATDTSAVEYYSLQGVRIDSPAKGQTVIRRHAGRSEKIIIR